MFTLEQIHRLLEVISRQNLTFISSKLGNDYLTQQELQRLQYFGINPFHNYNKKNDLVLQMFHLGLISDAIGEFDTKKLKYKDLLRYFESGDFIPLTRIQIHTLDSIKKQFLGDIKANEGRVFQDINNIVAKEEKNNRLEYEKVIRDEILRGKLQRKTSREIAQELGRKTGDWSRNFQRIVEYVSHQAFDEGRAAMIEDKYGKDVRVYKNVYPGACRHCISAYLTAGIGSEPKIFKLSTLKANGSNIGRKVDELKSVIGNHHPHCFDEQTEVLTDDGWKYFRELNKTEKFLSINLETGVGEWSKAIHWIDEVYEGNMHHFSNKSFDLMTTPNHHHVIKTMRAQQLRLVDTKNLPIQAHFLKHMPKWIGAAVDTFTFGERVFSASDFCEFMGFYLSEGCVINYKGRMRISISQSLHKYYEDIFAVCQRMFGSSAYRCKGYLQINLVNGDEELFSYLSLGKSFEKSIPNNIKNLTTDLLNVFLLSYCKGDGSFRKGRTWSGYQCKDSREFSTSSRRMADDLGELILKIGKNPSYTIRRAGLGVFDKNRDKMYFSNHPQYTVRELTNKFAIRSSANEQVVNYSGRIYDVELEYNNTLFVRRNGKVCVSGNCRCTLHKKDELYDWNSKTRSYDIPKKNAKQLVQTIDRKKIRVRIANKEYLV